MVCTACATLGAVTWRVDRWIARESLPHGHLDREVVLLLLREGADEGAVVAPHELWWNPSVDGPTDADPEPSDRTASLA